MEDIESYLKEIFPGNGKFQKYQRSFLKFITVDPKSNRTLENLKSQSVVKSEIFRHIWFHRNVIHCFSRFRYYWEFMMTITLGLAFILIPYEVAFCYGQKRLYTSIIVQVPILVIDVICVMNIFLNLHFGYQDHNEKIVVLKRKEITLHYLRSYFIVDLLSLFHIFSHPLFEPGDKISFHIALQLLSLLKLTQMPQFFNFLHNILQQKKHTSFYIKKIRSVLLIIFCYHVVVCSLFLVVRFLCYEFNEGSHLIVTSLFDPSSMDFDPTTRINPNSVTDFDSMIRFDSKTKDSLSLVDFEPVNKFGNKEVDQNLTRKVVEELNDLEKYIICLFYTTYTVTLFATEIEEESLVDIMIALIFTLIGLGFHIWLVSKAYIFIRTKYAVQFRFQETRNQLKKFLISRRLPVNLQRRALSLFDFKFKGRFFDKWEIKNSLEARLQRSVKYERCKEVLKDIHLFKNIPEDILILIAEGMQEFSYSTNDVILRGNFVRSQKLFLILSGTVAVYTTNGNEIAHLRDGSIFGEIAFLLPDENQPALNYVATEECILLIINRSDFMKDLAEKPKILNELRKSIRERLSLARRMTEEELIEKLKQRELM